ncbi:Resolvase [Limnobacter sp. 130]|uniref:recombinase family protein n=1 Tax=Limnobacter sp. 130 TaxID=2653147 RepID=UPI0012F33D3D|nr:recombinase family protein [Limnobacter sp. 130]VWX32818.1 Resolvase [Limnobacter sp. 130]
MVEGKFVAYFRVSTQKQGVNGLGMDAQRETVRQFLSNGGELVGEFVEVETGKGANALAKRPQLATALALCKKTGAKLLIAKLDRLARNVHFVSGLMESKVKFVACDMPEANDLTIHVMAAFAEHEAKRISQRTKEGLAAAKARGVVLGAAGSENLRQNVLERRSVAIYAAHQLAPVLSGFKAQGMSQRKMVEALNDAGVKTARGGVWSLVQLQRVLSRL